jgi:uncharacterized protein (TIGR02466 family)
MHLSKLFYQPMWAEEMVVVSDNQLTQAEKFCLGESHSSKGRVYSNNGGWQSEDYSYKDLVNTPLQTVLDSILEKLNECMTELGSSSPIEFETIWININKKNNSNFIHTHSGVLSGSFYVTVPDQSATIFFTREYDMEQWFYGSIGSQHNTEASSARIHIGPIDKLLVVFPSWMPHGVNPNPSDKDRISISFNTQLKI